MDQQRPDALTEAGIDGTIRRLLSVEASPEFLARVRTSVAEAPIASPFSRWLPALGGVAAIALLVVVAAISLSPTSAPEPARVPPSPAPAAAIQIELPRRTTMETASPIATNVRRVSTRAETAVASRTSDFPEVILAPDAVRNFQQVVASASGRRFEVSPEGVQALMDTSIPEIVIAPVNVFGTDQGALQ
jgi:hypothetical protein